MKKTFLFLTALVMSAMMWATEVTMAYSGSTTGNMTGENDAALVNLDDATWSVVGDKGGNNNFPGLNKAGQIRLYGAATNHNTITVTNLAEANITSIKVTYGTNNYNAKVTVDGAEVTGTGSDAEKTYAINSTSFTIAHNYSANTQVYILSIVITTSSTPTPQKEIVSLAIDGTATKKTYFVGEAFDPAGLTVTATYNDATTGDVTSEVDWTISPETFTEVSENASVNVTAKIDETESAQFQVNGIVVTVKEVTYANTYTSNVELTTTGGTSASTAKVVIDGTEYDAIKAGTGKVQGACVVTISAATEVLHFHAAGWNGETVVLDVNGTEYTLVADAGVSGSGSVFTLKNDPETQDYFTFDPQGATTITFTATSGFRFVLFGVNAELEQGVVAAPAFAPAATDFDGSVEVSLTCETEGADIFYAINEEVNSMNAIQYTEAITLTATTTIYAVAKKDGKESEQVSKTYSLIPVFESLEDLVTNMPAGENPVKVKVTITSAAIDSFYVNNSGNKNGIYTSVDGTVVELYTFDVPANWEVGGTVSSTIIAEWLSYKGTLELQKWEGGWTVFNYTAPDPTALQEIMINGNIRKLMHRGHIMILKGDKMFNLHGQLVK